MTPPAEILERLEEARSILCLTHIHGDGDGLGSMAALVHSARATGRLAMPMTSMTIPSRFEFLFERTGHAGEAALATLSRQADLIVLVDTCAYSQLGGSAEILRRAPDKTIVLDHHATFDEIGTARWVDPTAGATGVMMLETLEALGWPLPPEAV